MARLRLWHRVHPEYLISRIGGQSALCPAPSTGRCICTSWPLTHSPPIWRDGCCAAPEQAGHRNAPHPCLCTCTIQCASLGNRQHGSWSCSTRCTRHVLPWHQPDPVQPVEMNPMWPDRPRTSAWDIELSSELICVMTDRHFCISAIRCIVRASVGLSRPRAISSTVLRRSIHCSRSGLAEDRLFSLGDELFWDALRLELVWDSEPSVFRFRPLVDCGAGPLPGGDALELPWSL